MTWSAALRSDRTGHAYMGISNPGLEIGDRSRRRTGFSGHLRAHGFDDDILDEAAIEPSLNADGRARV